MAQPLPHLCLTQGHLEHLPSPGRAGDEYQIASWETKGAGEQFDDGRVGLAIRGWRGHAEPQHSVSVEAFASVLRGAGGDTDGEAGHTCSVRQGGLTPLCGCGLVSRWTWLTESVG